MGMDYNPVYRTRALTIPASSPEPCASAQPRRADRMVEERAVQATVRASGRDEVDERAQVVVHRASKD